MWVKMSKCIRYRNVAADMLDTFYGMDVTFNSTVSTNSVAEGNYAGLFDMPSLLTLFVSFYKNRVMM